jgi:hypothetical protein
MVAASACTGYEGPYPWGDPSSGGAGNGDSDSGGGSGSGSGGFQTPTFVDSGPWACPGNEGNGTVGELQFAWVEPGLLVPCTYLGMQTCVNVSVQLTTENAYSPQAPQKTGATWGGDEVWIINKAGAHGADCPTSNSCVSGSFTPYTEAGDLDLFECADSESMPSYAIPWCMPGTYTWTLTGAPLGNCGLQAGSHTLELPADSLTGTVELQCQNEHDGEFTVALATAGIIPTCQQ